MNTALIYLLIVILIVALAPVLLHTIQNRDFKRQIDGKQELRTSDKITAPQNQSLDASVQLELDKAIADTKVIAGMNAAGPK